MHKSTVAWLAIPPDQSSPVTFTSEPVMPTKPITFNVNNLITIYCLEYTVRINLRKRERENQRSLYERDESFF